MKEQMQKQQIAVLLPAGMREQLKALAASQYRSMNAQVVHILRGAIDSTKGSGGEHRA